MVVTLLGTGTGIPSSRRNPPGILMRFNGKSAVFDSGPGTLRNLLKCGVDCFNLDFIFYTHFHLDHISDFSAILFATKIPPVIRRKQLSVYGPTGLEDYYKKIRELYGETIFTDAYELELREIENKSVDIDGFKISTRALKHHGGSMGYRIVTPEGNVVVYSGDTDFCNEIIGLAKDADLLILECAFPDEMKMGGHLTPSSAGKVADKANAKKVVFVHMYPICEEYDLVDPCKKEFNGDVIVGEDLMEFEIS